MKKHACTHNMQEKPFSDAHTNVLLREAALEELAEFFSL